MPHTLGASHVCQLSPKGDSACCIGRTKGGLNSKLHAVRDGQGRPVALLLTEGQMSDHKGDALLLPAIPPACELLGDRGYDSNRSRAALVQRSISPCIPSTRSRKVALPYDNALYRQWHRIEKAFRLPQRLAPHRHALRPKRSHVFPRPSAVPQPLPSGSGIDS